MFARTMGRWVLIILAATAIATAARGAERFIDNGDGTVTDHQLGIMWAKHDNQGDLNWHEANQWVRFTFPFTLPVFYSNWRLPTLAELMSLVPDSPAEAAYESDCGQKVRIIPLIRLSCGWVWSSETDRIAPTASVFNYAKGYHYTVREAQRRGYRCLPVRDLFGMGKAMSVPGSSK